ncbi:GntR family transcriptional regulator [Leucobacter iarius]|uniref:GntR family transcriptional regulator n=1 Tax=Leucobacter iarius TaxID=333963 RepID=A0ABP4XZK9_9MICO
MPIPKRTAAIPERRLLRDEVRDALRTAIINGDLLPGERIDDRAVQEWLSVSRTPVRQALDALAAEGFVEIAAHAHTRVVTPDPADVPYVLSTIGVLVSGMARQAIPLLAPKGREAAAKLAESVSGYAASRDREGMLSEATLLINLMRKECRNPILQQVSDSVTIKFRYFLAVAAREGEFQWDTLAKLYIELAVAIRAGEVDTACHLVETIQVLSPEMPATA